MLDLLKTPQEHEQFDEIIESTNDYLRKNKGAAADFSILKDISERHLEKFDNEIGNLINVPLYIGLGGTFVGIIAGLIGIVGWKAILHLLGIGEDTPNEIMTQSNISQLLNGVIFAMVASFLGLVFTVINSWYYKSAAYKNESDRNNYYDFLQRELLPSLNTGVAKSLGNLNVVLNQFLAKFSENMDDYRDSGRLLNDNLSKQQFVLEEINKLSLTRTATKVAELFVDLKQSSEHLEKFLNYQEGLNKYLDKTETVTRDMESIIEHFKDFNLNLKAIGNNTLASIELQKQFKDSLEKHFPTISEHREVWREQIDELNQDVKKVYQELYNYFKEQTEQVKNYVDTKNKLLSETDDIRGALKVFVENSNVQKAEFELLQKEINGLRNDFKESQRGYNNVITSILTTLKEIKLDAKKESNETSEALIKALNSLNTSIKQIGKSE
ncbi:MAG: hypothetical protein LBS46_06360 [Dysgonamonadaceae bacterium]|nr:hypothetical protein [Dysgonamonadaceae bacterium]